MKYIVVSNLDKIDFENRINDLLKIGYKVEGNIQTCPYGNGFVLFTVLMFKLGI